ncbi:MAG: DNA repair exonuclease [Candidatus Diapherotrites archaeon]|nr:DNA repair exonuclease [Candidatus Diapherotrites archaeon]
MSELKGKIAFASDFHLGYAKNEELFKEAFENAAKVIELAMEKADALVLAGDIFDSDVPSQETWYHAFRVFSAVKGKSAGIEFVKYDREGNAKLIRPENFPIFATHGTHEFRGKDLRNALEILESAGLIYYIGAGRVEFEKVAIHFMGGVPETKAKTVLQALSPKAVQGKQNIFVLHQSFKEFLPFSEDVASLSIADLPAGFDLYVCGHMHWPNVLESNGKRLLLTGSTIFTQLKEIETKKEKGLWLYDYDTKKLEFVPIPDQRKALYITIKVKNSNTEDIKKKVLEELNSIDFGKFSKKPLIRIKLSGSLAKGVMPSEVNLSDVLKEFENKAIITISKDLEIADFKKRIDEIRKSMQEKKSISSIGLEILLKKLEESNFSKSFDATELFKLLEEGKIDKAEEKLNSKISD